MFTTLPYSHRFHLEHRLIGALLRSDGVCAQAILKEGLENSGDHHWIDRFYNSAFSGNLVVLIYQQICQLGLQPQMQSVFTADGCLLVDKLRQKTAQTLVDYSILNGRFLQILDLLGDLCPHVIWLKGTVLSRTLYQQPEHRFSVDFDIVINRTAEKAVISRLKAAGFVPLWNDAGHCHQFGVGPMNSFSDMFLVPADGCGGCHNLTFTKPGWPDLELKFNGLETGLTMLESERFFREAEKLNWLGRQFFGPSSIDHLMAELVHFHKHQFDGWGWLFDIHLLSNKLSEEEGAWSEFVRRCHYEGITTSAWRGLCMSLELLETRIPAQVLNQLKPKYIELWQGLLLDISSEFIWNCNSLPMLALNSLFVGGQRRKLKILADAFYPTNSFLSQYYANTVPITWATRLFYLIIHWLVLILPGGVVRRTFGQMLWPMRSDIQLNS